MGYVVKSEVEGLEQAMAQLRELPKKLAKKTLRKAGARAASILNKEAKALAPRYAGTPRAHVVAGLLKKAIGQKVKTYQGGLVVVGIIGARKGFRVQGGTTQRAGKVARGKAQKVTRAGEARFMDPTKVIHLVELGTRRSRASGFLRQAHARAMPRIRAEMSAIIAAGITEALQGA